MTYLRNLFDLLLAHWLLRNLRREVRGMYKHRHHQTLIDSELGYGCYACRNIFRKENTIHALQAHVAELERMLK